MSLGGRMSRVLQAGLLVADQNGIGTERARQQDVHVPAQRRPLALISFVLLLAVSLVLAAWADEDQITLDAGK
jgi:hypothetical protein